MRNSQSSKSPNQWKAVANRGPGRRQAVAVLVGALAALAGAGQAQAQQLEEVTVTAQKREQNLQDVPMAVSAFTGQSLRDAGISDIEDFARQVPSLQVQTSTSALSTNYRLRGVGNLGNIPTFEPAVGVFQDGAFRNRPVFSSGDMFDIERIEVLRGPQSTLYGKNTTAGVVAIYTRKPTEELSANAELTAGNLEGASDASLYRFVGGVSGPLTDTVSGSLGLSYTGQDHLMDSALSASDEGANDVDRSSLRGQLQWQPTDALNMRLIGGVLQQDDDQSLSDVYFSPGGKADTFWQNLQDAGLAESCSSNDPLDLEHCARKAVTSEIDANEGTLLVDYALNNGWTIDSITSYDWFKFEGSIDDLFQAGSPILKFQDTQEADSWQQELRLTSAGGETVDWLVGTFYYHNEFQRGDQGDRPLFVDDIYSSNPVVAANIGKFAGRPFPIPAALPGQLGIFDGRQDTDYLAFFGQATWNITDKFSVTGGMRWQQEEKDASVQQSTTIPGLSLVWANLTPNAEIYSGDMDRDTDKTTWSITPQYAITDDLNVYATVSEGFKSGGFNVGWGPTAVAVDPATGKSPREFDNEKVTHYEAGLKSTLLNGSMQLAVNAFYAEYDDYQDATFVSQVFIINNAARAELKGVEAEGKVLLGEHLSADFAVSYADFTYEEYTNGLCYAGRVPDGSTPGTCDLSGEHPLNAPEWTSNLGLMYETDVSWGQAYARGDWTWSDEYFATSQLDPNIVQDSYSWLNLRVGTRWDNFDLAAWVENATDEDVNNFSGSLNVLGSGDASYQTWRQPPRSYGLTLRYDL